MFAQILPGDTVLRTLKVRHNLQSLSANIRILPVSERLDCCCNGGNVTLDTTKGVCWTGRKPFERILAGAGVENSRLETKFPRTRASTLVSRNRVRDLDLVKQLTPEQHGPGLVSTSCISLEDTSAVLADKLSELRIAPVMLVRANTRLVIACPIRYSNFVRSLKMDKKI